MNPSHLILCVDDDPIIRNGLARMLQRAGAEVVTASNGHEALELLRRTGARPDLIFTDLEMPVLDGEAFLRELRGDPALARIPVVVVSGTHTREPVERHIWKPFSADEVLGARRALCRAGAA
jgi:CheY-like chemotaxis protein